jgi:alkylation response protein AidB-like acyl-CoA dehydrogenase
LYGAPDERTFGDVAVRGGFMKAQAKAKDDLTGVMDQVRALRGLIEASALADEEATELSDEVREAVERSDILRLMSPREVDGLEAQPDLLIDVISELAYYDGSVGWYTSAVMTAGAMCGAYLGQRAVDAIFQGGRALAAGQAAPTGKAERVDDGYRISGKFAFGSGTPTARYLVGGYVLHEEGEAVLDSHGQPLMLLALAPRSTVEFLGNWDVLGLRGTGSYDFRVAEQFVHDDFIFSPTNPTIRRGGALYRMGFMAMPCISHASVALGIARRALDEWAIVAQTKKRPRGYANELHTLQRDLAFAQGEMRAADAYVRRTYSELFAYAERGEPAPESLRLDGRLCASFATLASTRACQAAFMSCTTSALRNGSILQRCFRDAHATVSHILTGEQSLLDEGAVLAKAPGAFLVF